MSEFTEILNYLENEEKKIKNKKAEDYSLNVKSRNNPRQFFVENENKNVNGFDVDLFKNNMKKELISNNLNWKKYRSEFISVTELLTCQRMVYYDRKNYEINLEEKFNFPNLYLIQEVGKHIHNKIQRIYEFDECEKNIISKKFNIKGKVDTIIDNSVIEIKTVDEYLIKNFNYDVKHYYQGLIYSYILNTEYDDKYKINNISIVYIFRNLKDIKVYNLPIDSNKAKSFLEKSLYITKCLKENIIPIINKKDINEEECKYCSYKKYCKDNKIKEQNSKVQFLL